MPRDIRIAVGFLDHPKTIKLEKRLGFDGVKCLIRLWEFAAQSRTKGVLDGMNAEDIAIAAKWQQDVEQFVDALLTLRWLDAEQGVYSLHDWEEHQGFIFYSEERRRSAKKAGKASARKRACEADIERPVDDSLTTRSTERSTPSPSPSPIPKEESNTLSGKPDAVSEIVSVLNEICGTKYKATTPKTKVLIQARQKEGFTLSDFRAVIQTKFDEWGPDGERRQYLRPETLFGTKFEAYLNQSSVRTHKEKKVVSRIVFENGIAKEVTDAGAI